MLLREEDPEVRNVRLNLPLDVRPAPSVAVDIAVDVRLLFDLEGVATDSDAGTALLIPRDLGTWGDEEAREAASTSTRPAPSCADVATVRPGDANESQAGEFNRGAVVTTSGAGSSAREDEQTSGCASST